MQKLVTLMTVCALLWQGLAFAVPAVALSMPGTSEVPCAEMQKAAPDLADADSGYDMAGHHMAGHQSSDSGTELDCCEGCTINDCLGSCAAAAFMLHAAVSGAADYQAGEQRFHLNAGALSPAFRIPLYRPPATS